MPSRDQEQEHGADHAAGPVAATSSFPFMTG